MRLGWYINRLRSMEPAEILHRLVEKRHKLASRRDHQGWRHYPAPALHAVFSDFWAKLAAANPAQRQAIAMAAEATLAGRFSALGRDWPLRDPADLFPADFWRLDPVTGHLWPDAQTYGFDIDFRHDGSRGDVKYVWEINRLQFLPVLASQYLLAGDERCLAAIEAAIASWHEANPPFGGVGWASGIEAALRAISLILVLDLAGPHLTTATLQRIGQILAATAFWLPRFPSRFSSANNHLVAELAGQYLAGLALGTEPQGARTHLLAELQKQILPDGAGAEQTPTYAAFTAEMVLFCALAAREAGNPFPVQAQDRLFAFADFIAWLGPDTGFGDDDEGRVLTLGDEADYAGSVAAAICGFLGRPGPAEQDGDFRAVVFGTPSASLAPPKGLRTFRDGGLSLWHGDLSGHPVDLRFDHGPLGYLSIAAHGHADALSLTLDIDGHPMLVDPGTFLYGSGGAWRDWFRSTPAHNTLNIDGASQSVISGAFNWSHKAKAGLVESRPQPDWSLSASHDGYRARFGTIHQRTIARDADAITIRDQLLGTARTAEIVFQLAPDIEAQIDGEAVTLRCDGDLLLTIMCPEGAMELAGGGEKPGQGGWFSPRFGSKIPAPRLAWRGHVDEAGVVFRLLPGEASGVN